MTPNSNLKMTGFFSRFLEEKKEVFPWQVNFFFFSENLSFMLLRGLKCERRY